MLVGGFAHKEYKTIGIPIPESWLSPAHRILRWLLFCIWRSAGPKRRDFTAINLEYSSGGLEIINGTESVGKIINARIVGSRESIV
jgi:hypothetical protein